MSTSVRTYSRGRKLVAMRDVQAGTSRYYHFDHQGTTQCLTDGSGNVTDRFSSDAWGVQVKRSGSSINRQWYIGAEGYYTRGQSYNARARELQSSQARWLSKDVVSSENAFVYADNSPAARVDPSGYASEPTWEWRPGKFRYYDPPLRDWPRINRIGKCDLLTRIKCDALTEGIADFALRFGLPLFAKQIAKYRTNSGLPMLLQSSIIKRLLTNSYEDRAVCSRAILDAARYAEKHLFPPGRCSENPFQETWWNLYYDGHHRYSGLNTPKVYVYEDADLY